MAGKKRIPKKKTTKKKNKSRRNTKSSSASNKESCFTIMPFGGWFDDYYMGIYKPAIEAAGMDAVRADDLYRPSTIVNDIWDCTQKSSIVLADLTGKNANVFYELGLAHALAKPAILVTETMDDVPFDLRALRVIEYNKNKPNWGESLKYEITESINQIRKSPLESVLPAFLNIKPRNKGKEITATEKEILSMKQDLDMLRHEVLRSKRVVRNEIGMKEAEGLIQRYIESGMPRSIIISRLTDRGAPKKWVEDRILGSVIPVNES